jgi:superfamily II helicase
MMITKTAQTSLLDFLMDVMPDMQNFTLVLNPGAKKDPNAEALYNIWSDIENKVADRKFLRPTTLSSKEVENLESAGLVQASGKYLRVTSKGVKAIRQMILNSEKSAFEKSASSSGMTKVAQVQEQAPAGNWYMQQRAIDQQRAETHAAEQMSEQPESLEDESNCDVCN